MFYKIFNRQKTVCQRRRVLEHMCSSTCIREAFFSVTSVHPSGQDFCRGVLVQQVMVSFLCVSCRIHAINTPTQVLSSAVSPLSTAASLSCTSRCATALGIMCKAIFQVNKNVYHVQRIFLFDRFYRRPHSPGGLESRRREETDDSFAQKKC